MEARGRKGWRIAIISAIGVFAALPQAPALADHPLAPDLVTVRLSQDDLRVVKEKGTINLRLDNRIGNAGAGPMEVRPGAGEDDCDGDGNPRNDVPGYQRIYDDVDLSGTFDPLFDTAFTTQPIGCMRYHPAHEHWHVTSAARYELIDESSGDAVESNKVGFCLIDSERMTRGNYDPTYRGRGCGKRGQEPEVIGISPGYADLYNQRTPGQRIGIARLERGRYCLRSTADPTNTLLETDDFNNSTELRVMLDPERERVDVLSRRCKLKEEAG